MSSTPGRCRESFAPHGLTPQDFHQPPHPSGRRGSVLRSRSSAGAHSSAKEELKSRNRHRLAAFHAASDPLTRLRLRNALVEDNLPLVFSLAGRWGQRCEMPFEDLVQVASMGLIRAIEAFDPGRSGSLSSFAVPYIQGAIMHEIRDRQHLMRVPRQLWELRQKISRLQDERRRQGLPPLQDQSLASALGCEDDLVHQTRELRHLTAIHSLDAPLGRSGDDGLEAASLLEQVPDPSTGRMGREEGGDAVPDPDPSNPQWLWLRQRLQDLDPVRRQLLEGRLVVGCTWVELGQLLGMPPRQAQRRCLAALDQLRREAEAWGGRRDSAVPFPRR